jgi:hypothetical protein
MKRCYFIVFACFFFLFSFSQNNEVIKSNGKWNNNATWALGHGPKDGEIAIVPADSTLIVDNNMQITTDITLKVYGNLVFNVGKLRLTTNSVVLLYDGATITTQHGNASDKIEIGGVTKYSGNDGTLDGPLMASSSTTGFTSIPFVVPVKFIAYSVSHKAEGIAIRWSTAEEENVAFYDVERSKDGTNWQTIGQVKPSSKPAIFNNYSYTDKEALTDVIYYRVKQIDFDGHFIYTSISSIKLAPSSFTNIKIASATENLIVKFAQPVKGNVVIRLIALSGQVIKQKTYYRPTGDILFNHTSYKGFYILRISNEQEVNFVKQIFLN